MFNICMFAVRIMKIIELLIINLLLCTYALWPTGYDTLGPVILNIMPILASYQS